MDAKERRITVCVTNYKKWTESSAGKWRWICAFTSGCNTQTHSTTAVINWELPSSKRCKVWIYSCRSSKKAFRVHASNQWSTQTSHNFLITLSKDSSSTKRWAMATIRQRRCLSRTIYLKCHSCRSKNRKILTHSPMCRTTKAACANSLSASMKAPTDGISQ